MADIQLKDFDAIDDYTGFDDDDYIYLHDDSDDLEKKGLLSAFKTWIFGNKTIGGTTAGDIVDNNSAQTMTNKRLTNPKINEDVAMTGTATALNALASSYSDIISWIQTLAGYGGHTTLTRNAATQTLSSKTLTAPTINGGTVNSATLDDCSLDDPTITSSAILPADTSIGSVTATEIAYLSGLDSNIQDQIDAITGGSIYYDSYISSSTGGGITTLTWTKNDILTAAGMSTLLNINYKSINCRAYLVDSTKNTQVASNTIEVNQSTGDNLSSVKFSSLTASTPYLFVFTFRTA